MIKKHLFIKYLPKFVLLIIILILLILVVDIVKFDMGRNRIIILSVLIVLIAFFSYSMKFTSENQINLIIVFFSVILTLFSFEIYLFYYDPLVDKTPEVIENIAKIQFFNMRYDRRT